MGSFEDQIAWEEKKATEEAIAKRARQQLLDEQAEERRSKQNSEATSIGEAVGFSYIKPSLGQYRTRFALLWLDSPDAWKWGIAGVAEVMLGVVALVLIAINPLLWFLALPMLLVPFVPYLYCTYLLKSRKAVHFADFNGEGYLWQRKSKLMGEKLELLNSMANDPDGTNTTKIAYAKMEPVIWNVLVKSSALTRKRIKYRNVDGDAKKLINDQFRVLDRRLKELEEVIVACSSLEVSEVDFDLGSGDATDIVKGVRDEIKGRRELNAGTIEL